MSDLAEFGIGELVARTGVPASSIHHYRRLGMLPVPRRASASRFLYDQRHVERVQQIRKLRNQGGLSLRRIAELLDGQAGTIHSSGSKQKLRDLATELFSLQGYTEVSVADLCSQADVAKGTFYRHYKSKQDLFLQAVEAAVDDAAASFATAVAGERSLDSAELTRRLAVSLRPGLPIMLEVAKRSVQGQVEHAAAAQRVFWRLAVQIGDILSDDPAAHRQAGSLILDAVGHVFAEGLMGRFDDRPSFG